MNNRNFCKVSLRTESIATGTTCQRRAVKDTASGPCAKKAMTGRKTLRCYLTY